MASKDGAQRTPPLSMLPPNARLLGGERNLELPVHLHVPLRTALKARAEVDILLVGSVQLITRRSGRANNVRDFDADDVLSVRTHCCYRLATKGFDAAVLGPGHDEKSVLHRERLQELHFNRLNWSELSGDRERDGLVRIYNRFRKGLRGGYR
jgi:hypothetical protein